jgi:arachidonate 15-lipoxygenase
MKPSLPQNDTDPTKRKSLLERNQGEYEFDHDFLAPMAMLKDVPSSENFSTKYIAERTVESAELPINMLAVNTRSLWDPLDEL